MVLVPKNTNPVRVNDYRTISLLNSSIKMITKLHANKLQSVILKVIHRNQYGFIISRTIQDCLACAFEYLHLCHKTRKELVLLKLDFEKAFDKVEHEVILQVMR
jgi:retron-type reverse transcriptase